MNRRWLALSVIALIVHPGVGLGAEVSFRCKDARDQVLSASGEPAVDCVRDISLRERYASEEQIEADRKQDLKLVEISIARARENLGVAQEERNHQLQNEVNFYMNRPLPEDLAEKLRANARIQMDAQKTIDDGEAMERRINRNYDSMLKRYRGLKDAKRP
jgi:hypothetical protein